MELPDERLTADFNGDSILELSPDLVGPSITRNSGIIGEGVDLGLKHLGDIRPSTSGFQPHAATLCTQNGATPAKNRSSICSGSSSASPSNGSTPAWCAKATPTRRCSCTRSWRIRLVTASPRPSLASSRVHGRSRRCSIHTIPPAQRATFGLIPRGPTVGKRVQNPASLIGLFWTAIGRRNSAASRNLTRKPGFGVKNHNLGLKCPIVYGSETRKYLPDYQNLVDDGRAPPVRWKARLASPCSGDQGLPTRKTRKKKSTMDTYWVPGVNHLGADTVGGAFAEFTGGLPNPDRLCDQGPRRVQQDDCCGY